MSFAKTLDPDDNDDKSIESCENKNINEMMDYLDLCERGLVTYTSPTQLPVLTCVLEHNRDLFQENIFLANNDVTDGINRLADPDEFVNFGLTCCNCASGHYLRVKYIFKVYCSPHYPSLLRACTVSAI